MLKYLAAASFGAVLYIGFVAEADNKIPVKDTAEAYSQCRKAPETKLTAQILQEKYDSLTQKQLIHIICKDKR